MATLETQLLDGVIARSRRRMLTVGGAALAGMLLKTSAAEAQTTTTPTYSDTDILNFALSTEFLGGNYYALGVMGMTLGQLGATTSGVIGTFPTAAPGSTTVPAPTTGAGGTVITKGNNNYASCKVNFQNSLVAGFSTNFLNDEKAHLAFLQSALGSSAVAQPTVDLYNSFNTLAQKSGLGLSSFDPFADDASFVLGAFMFEDVDVSAYTGAAPLISSPNNLDAAAGIQGVEAYHAGIIRTMIAILDGNAAGNVLNGQTVASGMLSVITQAVAKLRATLDGSIGAGKSSTGAAISYPNGDDIGVGTQQVALNGSSNVTASSLFDCSTTGSFFTPGTGSTDGSLVASRTIQQVLNIVYGGSSATPGGFFPNGLNGDINTI